MSSSLSVNFSLRQNKAIERSISFDVLQQGRRFFDRDPVYVGFGSIWFQDFRMAHRTLGIATMVSIEGNEQVLSRARFNRPYRCVDVRGGYSTEVIPELLQEEGLCERSWVVWLDYDGSLSPERLDELTGLIETLPSKSALLTTFNSREKQYGKDTQARRRAMLELFGEDIVGDDQEDAAFDGPGFMSTLGRCLQSKLVSKAIQAGRRGGFVPAVRLLYKDTAEMVTVGGFLPSAVDAAACRAMVENGPWFGFEDAVIESQPLTLREVYALCTLLPNDDGLSGEDVRALGFELPDDQLRFFERHYKRYPTYAEVL